MLMPCAHTCTGCAEVKTFVASTSVMSECTSSAAMHCAYVRKASDCKRLYSCTASPWVKLQTLQQVKSVYASHPANIEAVLHQIALVLKIVSGKPMVTPNFVARVHHHGRGSMQSSSI